MLFHEWILPLFHTALEVLKFLVISPLFNFKNLSGFGGLSLGLRVNMCYAGRHVGLRGYVR